MATSEQIKSLIRSHLTEDSERFYSVALQVAAHEARQGHTALAHDIREIINKDRSARGAAVIKFPKDMLGLVSAEKPETPKSALVIASSIDHRITRIIHEYKQQNKLKAHGLVHRRKVLLMGPPGIGKTMTARVLAHELNLHLYTIQVDRLVTKFMGETSAKLRQIFELIQEQIGVYLFDEFDAIGGERSLENDVGEMRRVLNSFLQFIERDTSDSIIVAATNSPQLLDRALFRRFDDVMYYEYPTENERKELIKNILGSWMPLKITWNEIIEKSKNLSHAEIDQACRDGIKNAILNEKLEVSSKDLFITLDEKSEANKNLRR
jgi:SpoVK/Ycf46/Vps4 family AAA+-type ATPase